MKNKKVERLNVHDQNDENCDSAFVTLSNFSVLMSSAGAEDEIM